jgi:hypothetical protein
VQSNKDRLQDARISLALLTHARQLELNQKKDVSTYDAAIKEQKDIIAKLEPVVKEEARQIELAKLSSTDRLIAELDQTRKDILAEQTKIGLKISRTPEDKERSKALGKLYDEALIGGIEAQKIKKNEGNIKDLDTTIATLSSRTDAGPGTYYGNKIAEYKIKKQELEGTNKEIYARLTNSGTMLAQYRQSKSQTATA